MNTAYIQTIKTGDTEVDIILYDEVADCELDEMWSFVGKKANQRWLWLALERKTRKILAFTLGRRKDEVFEVLKALLEPFGIGMFYSDDWGSYERKLEYFEHTVAKRNTQTIERKNLTIRTRVKRLCRRTICFSKSTIMHDTVIGLLINILEFEAEYKSV